MSKYVPKCTCITIKYLGALSACLYCFIVYQLMLGYSTFLYYEPLGILAIPYSSYNSSNISHSSGLRLFDVTGSGIAQRGEIPVQSVSSGYGSYADTVDRSVIIGTDIYVIAHRSVTVAGTAQLDIKKVIGLPEGYYSFLAGEGLMPML